MSNTETRLEQLEVDFPNFLPVVARLNQRDIPWALVGSGCLFVFGNERHPKDIDFFVRDEDHDSVDTLFGITSEQYRSDIEDVRNSHPLHDDAMQITSGLRLMIDGKKYQMSFTPAQPRHRHCFEYKGEKIWTAAPEDVLISKALLKRGDAERKHDVQDIRDFLAVYQNPDLAYAKERIRELDGEKRAGRLLHELFWGTKP